MRPIPGFEDLERGLALHSAGSITEAVAAFLAAGESGVAEGYIQIANIELKRGDSERARYWMRKAEAIAEQGDSFANLCCSLAYQIGYGEGPWDEQERKRRSYLRKAAELGDAVAQNLLAHELLLGLNGMEQNEEEYEYWIARAIEQGSPDALIEHILNRRKAKRDIEPSLMTKLAVLARDSERARALLQKITAADQKKKRSTRSTPKR